MKINFKIDTGFKEIHEMVLNSVRLEKIIEGSRSRKQLALFSVQSESLHVTHGFKFFFAVTWFWFIPECTHNRPLDLMELRTFAMLPQELCCDMIHELHTNRLEKLSMPSSFVSLSNREAARFSMNEAFLICSNARVSCLRGHMQTETTYRILVNLLHHTLSLYYLLSRDPVKTDGRVDIFPMNILNQNR